MEPKLLLRLLIAVLFFCGYTSVQAANQLHAVQVKNESAVDANDFHAEASSGQKIATASAKDASGDKVFPDKVLDPPGTSWDWPASSNLKAIPPGGTMTVLSEPGKVNTATSYFTRDGVKIATSCLDVKVRLESSSSNSGTFSITNKEAEPVVCTSVQLYTDDPVNPLSFLGWSPTGNLVAGIPPVVTLAPGQTVSYPFTYTTPAFYVSSHFFAAFASEPLNTYEFTDSYQQAVIIPTLTQWGLIILGFALLAAGSVYLYKRKRTAIA